MKRLSVMFPALLLVALLLASCGGDGGGTGGKDTTDYNDELPGDLNFNGDTFSYLTRNAGYLNSNMDVEELNGEVLNDAIYTRNRSVEERLNIKFKEYAADGFGLQNEEARRAVMAGDDIYDITYCEDYPTLSMAFDGYYLDFESLPYVNLKKSYWSQSINPSLSIHNKLFFAYSDSNLTPSDYTHAILFNKSIAENYGLDNLYELVNSGKWDYAAYAENAVKVINDLNGDGVMDENDQYGFISQSKNILPCFWVAGEAQAIKKDENDTPYFNIATDNKFLTIVDKVYSMTWDNGSWLNSDPFDDMTVNGFFASGKSLFFDCTLYYIPFFRTMDQDFGILPYPKYDEAQENYHTRVEGGCVPGVPVTSYNKLDKIGAVLEAWAAESAKTVIPAYFDISLKGKSARDDDSEAMLELIYNTRTYDLGDTYWCELLRDGIFLTIFRNNQRDFASQIAANESQIQSEIQKIIDAFDALES